MQLLLISLFYLICVWNNLSFFNKLCSYKLHTRSPFSIIFCTFHRFNFFTVSLSHFNAADCTVPISVSPENLLVWYHIQRCFAICRFIMDKLLFWLPSCLFPTFTDNPNCLCHYYQSTLEDYYNCYYYFVINYRSDSTTQSPSTKKKNGYGEKGKKKTRATNK